MKILALEKAGGSVPAAEYAPYLEDEARAVWNLVQAGLIEFELIELQPYPGYARLFTK